MHKLIKTKALLQIFLIISLSFYSSLSFAALNQPLDSKNLDNREDKVTYFDLIKQDFLPSVDAAQKVCCEKTKTTSDFQGESCVFADINDCETNKLGGGEYSKEAVACEQTDYCGLNCCIKDGVCQDKVERGKCELNKGQVLAGECSSQDICKVGCCNLPSGASLTTNAQCANTVKNFPGLDLSKVFDPSITDAATCVARSRGTDEGCCVLNNECLFGTRKQCNDRGGNEDSFKLGKICSGFSSCLATPKSSTTCYQNKVYWVDSRGQRENIYGFEYSSSGQVVKPGEQGSCALTYDASGKVVNDLNCGNCDYSLGSVCQTADDKFLTRLKNSNIEGKERVKHQCVPLYCETTQKSKLNSEGKPINPWMDGERRENGESWCEYEGKTGEGKDLVGSRQYVHKCLNGREIIDYGTDY